ncbi:MAG TPA: response regulator transcription factor [Candidatus Acidoferrum sp.]|nr:response regulator transcription factor [Candidatus Acidoferrum sp.]
MSEPIAPRILLVDDHAVLRRGVRQLLAEDLPDADFGEAPSGSAALEMVRAQTWNLVILDLSMPGRDGLDVLKEARALSPGLPILVLSMHGEEQYAIRALRAGAAGYVTKESAPEELTRAVRKALDGGRYVSPAMAERLAAAVQGSGMRAPHEALSDRELQVFVLLAQGTSVKEIGVALALSEKTISTYRTRILDKMNMRSNAELMRYALRVGLVE